MLPRCAHWKPLYEEENVPPVFNDRHDGPLENVSHNDRGPSEWPAPVLLTSDYVFLVGAKLSTLQQAMIAET